MKYLLLVTVCGLAVGCNKNSPPTSGEKTTPNSATSQTTAPSEPRDRTNTGVNARDRESTAKTPLDQNENQADVKTTADIRKRVLDAKLSVNARNVKIVAQDGKVTLRGPVDSDDEKRKIDEIAKDVAGANSVDNQLEVSNK
jgi:hyperosmotically inducible periplasmic protein